MHVFLKMIASSQMDDNWTLMKEGQTGTLSRGEWLASFLEPGATIGVDPFLMPVSEWNSMTKCLNGSNMKLIGVKTNLVDQVWGSNQPDRPNQPIGKKHGQEYSTIFYSKCFLIISVSLKIPYFINCSKNI